MQLNPLPPPPSVHHYAHNVRYVIIEFINKGKPLRMRTALATAHMVPVWQFVNSALEFLQTKY
jgi:hypothetical protein